MKPDNFCQKCFETELKRLFPINIELPAHYRPIFIGRVAGINCYRFLGQFMVKIDGQWKGQQVQ